MSVLANCEQHLKLARILLQMATDQSTSHYAHTRMGILDRADEQIREARKALAQEHPGQYRRAMDKLWEEKGV